MIDIALIVGAGLFLLATFWDEIVDWLQKAVSAVKKAIKGILYGVKVLVNKTKEGVREIAKYYSKNGTQWEETTKSRIVAEYDVPEDIRRRAEYEGEVDISKQVEEKLKLAN